LHPVRASEAWTAPCRRVLCGGSWNNNPENLRSAKRNRNTTDNRNHTIGFRVASTLQQPEPVPPRSHRACTKRPGPSMMSTVGGPAWRLTPRRRRSWERHGLRRSPPIYWPWSTRENCAICCRCSGQKLARSGGLPW